MTGACRPHIRQLLLAHGVIVESDMDDAHEDAHTAHPGCRAFDHMEAGLQYCEERFLEVGCMLPLMHSNASSLGNSQDQAEA